MGFFGNMKQRWRISAAAGIVRGQLERQVKLRGWSVDSRRIAQLCVVTLWNTDPYYFSHGSGGVVPGKYSIAVAALALAASEAHENNPHRNDLIEAACGLLIAVDRNGHRLSLNAADRSLIWRAAGGLEKVAESAAAIFNADDMAVLLAAIEG